MNLKIENVQGIFSQPFVNVNTPGKIAGPWEWEKSYSCDVMNEHFYKVFSPDVRELWDG